MDSGTVDIKDLELGNRWIAYLTKAALTTASEALKLSAAQLAIRTRLGQAECAQILHAISNQLCALPQNDTRTIAHILELDEPPDPGEDGEDNQVQPHEPESRDVVKTFTTGDEGIDRLIGGGIELGSVTEVAGQSAAGKSNFALQLATTVQLPYDLGGLDGSCLFVSSEGELASPRLLDFAAHRLAAHPGRIPNRTRWDFLDNVHVSKGEDSETVESILRYYVPAAIERIARAAAQGQLLPRKDANVAELEAVERELGREEGRKAPLPVRLVVVDSIAAPFRGRGTGAMLDRAKELVRVGEVLKRIAHKYEVAIVVVNQVAGVFDDRPPPQLVPPQSSTNSNGNAHSASQPFLPPKRPRLSSPPHPASGPGSSSPPPPSWASSASVTDQFHVFARTQARFYSGQSAVFPHQAALGPTWAQQLNTRLMLSRTERRRHRSALPELDQDAVGMAGEGEVVRLRRMEVVFSPGVPRGRIDYVVEEGGLVSVGEVVMRHEVGEVRGDEE